jgi:hypothetical protein
MWGSDRAYELPPPTLGKEWAIGAAPSSWLSMQDAGRFVSRRHAVLIRESQGWLLRDAGSKNGTWEDCARRPTIPLVSGIEIGIGAFRLIAESPRSIQLRALLARILGWDPRRARIVDRALRALREAATLRSPLYLVGESDLVAIARRIHREVLGPAKPFIVADPRRRRGDESTRAPINYLSGRDAVRAAIGGTLCIWSGRRPRDFATVLAEIDDPDKRARLVLCSRAAPEGMIAIRIPAISARRHEVDRIIAEYATDAIAVLGARPDSFTARDHAWIVARRPGSFAEIERSALRLVAIREWGGITRAAPHLGISHTTLSRWIGRRGLPR